MATRKPATTPKVEPPAQGSEPAITLDVTDPILFNRLRETKNKIVYTETPPPGAEAVIGTLYVDKAYVQQLGDPDKIGVVIE